MKRNFLIWILVVVVCKISSAQPLKVGNKCPDFFFKKIINSQKSSGNLSDYKGKLVILDFWGTFCSTCIADFPKKQNLQNKFGDSIKIIAVSDEENASNAVPVFWAKNKITKTLTLPCIIDDDKILEMYFPKETLGLQVWIDGNGIVKGITTPEYVNEKNIRAILYGEDINMPVYGFMSDKMLPLLKTNEIGGANPKLLYYSSLFKYLPSISQDESAITIIDSLSNTKVIRNYNIGIVPLYLGTLTYHPIMKISYGQRIIWQVRDSSKYFYSTNLGYEYEWRTQNAYCYEAKIPLDMPDSVFLESKRQDLNKFFGIKTIQKKKLVKCYLLVSTRNDHSPRKKVIPSSGAIDEGRNQLDNEMTVPIYTTANLVSAIEARTGLPVLDSTQIHKNIDVTLLISYDRLTNKPKDVTKVEEFNMQLENYGLKLIPGEKWLDFLMITD